MKRPRIVSALAASGLLLLSLTGSVRPLQAESARATTVRAADDGQRPNFVVVLTDDQTLEQLAFMPATQRLLVRRGLTFTNALATYPLCCPSRASLLTGRYPTNHGILTNTGNRDQSPALAAAYRNVERSALPVALRRRGYFTGYVGKYLNGYGPSHPAPPPGWADWRGATQITNYRRTTLNENGVTRTYQGFQTDLLGRKAVNMVERASAFGLPFYIQLSTFAPHLSSSSEIFAARDRNLFTEEVAPRSDAFDEADASDKFILRPPLGPDRIAAIDERWRDELRSLQAVDRAVERLVEALQRTRTLANTYIVFTSDNGFFHGEHRIGRGKYFPYEPAVHIPLVIAGPGVPAADRGTTVDEPVAGIDLVPTILHYARAQAVIPPDGVSLHRMIEGRRSEDWYENRHVLLMGAASADCRCAPTYSGVRTARWMYWTATSGTELYDLTADPLQLENLAGRPEVAAVEQRLEAARQALVSCAGAACGRPANWTPWD
jgi:arylsulfatase A-like enzyme